MRAPVPRAEARFTTSRPKYVFLNRYFHPDLSATSQLLSDLAFYLAAQGEQVHVIASRQFYDDARASLPAWERLRNVEVHRIATTRFGRGWLPGRAIDYISFYFSAALKVLGVAQRDDIVVAKTDPPLLSVLVSALSVLRGYKTVNWIQDLYPEIAIQLGISGLSGTLGRSLVAVRNASLRHATCNVAIGADMAELLRRSGLPPHKLHVIANWTDDSEIVQSDLESNSVRRQWALKDKFVVAYSGNLGRAHDIETLLGAAEHLRERTDIVFLFVGDGQMLSDLQSSVRERGLQNFLFKSYQRRDLLSQSLGAADVHWLSLKAGLDGLILPSKFYGIAAAGRPVIIVGSEGGEFAKLVCQFDSGFHVGLGQSEEFASIIVLLAENHERCREMGANARHMLEERFTRGQALVQWHTLLRSAAVVSKQAVRG